MVTVLKKRAEFQRAARGKKQVMPGFVLQIAKRPGDVDGPARFGFTCSKRVGNAVIRNRAKRRLRSLARDVAPELSQNGYDYVLIGRAERTCALPYAQLCADLKRSLQSFHSAQ